ncbi:hypothetical protein D3C79_528050 [compost metagenome]
MQRIAKQVFGVGRDIGIGEVIGISLPGDRRQALDQAAVVIFTAAQLLLQSDAPRDLRAESTIDADHHGQNGYQQEHAGQAVDQHVMPERTLIDHITYPALLDVADLRRTHVGHDLVENTDQDFLVPWCSHRQLIAVGGFAADIEPFELELAQGPDAGGEIADHGVHFVDGQCLQGRADIGHGHQVEVWVVDAQQLVGRVVLDHGDLQAVQVLDRARLRAARVGEDDDGEIEVRAGEGQVALALGRRHDAGKQVDAVMARLVQHLGPIAGLDRLERHPQALLKQCDVIGGQSLVPAFLVAKLERWP